MNSDKQSNKCKKERKKNKRREKQRWTQIFTLKNLAMIVVITIPKKTRHA